MFYKKNNSPDLFSLIIQGDWEDEEMILYYRGYCIILTQHGKKE